MIYSIIFLFVILFISFITLKVNKQYDGNLLSVNISNILRGIAILLVILQHISGHLGTNIFTPMGGTGVAIFLFLSGFGLNESFKKKGFTDFWKNRINKVFIPYIVLISIITIVKYNNFNLKIYLYDILGIKTSYWYIAFLLKQYILFYICSKFFCKVRLYIFVLCSIIFLFTFPNIEAEQSFSFLTCVLISEYYQDIKRMVEKRYLVVSIIFFIIGTIFLGIKQLHFIRLYEGHYIYSIIQLFIKLPYALLFISIVHYLNILISSRFLKFSGKISYELYLVHMIFLQYINSNIYTAFLVIIVSYIISYLFFLFNSFISSKLKKIYTCY